ncbi:MAG: hypothetical protein MK135_06570 [Polyangiaceae bacterium]|nr:hypothetical protein [Polyangiaceae bacterium]
MSNSQAQRFGTLSPLTHLLLKVPMVNRSVVARSLKTPHGRLRPEEEKDPRAQGHEVMVQGRRQVRALQYGSGPQILLVHGWGGAGVQMAAFVDPLVERGYSVVVVDLPAHGGSEGRTT